MKAINKEIINGVGLGEVKFGQEREKVEEILGKPDEKESYSYDEDEQTEDWHYDDFELSLGFDEEEDWKLYTMAITSKEYKFRDFYPIGLTKEELMEKLKEIEINDVELEDVSTVENPKHELISSESLGINFWFDEDELTEVQWGPLYSGEDTVDWPE